MNNESEILYELLAIGAIKKQSIEKFKDIKLALVYDSVDTYSSVEADLIELYLQQNPTHKLLGFYLNGEKV